MVPIQIISKNPEHPVLAWRDNLMQIVPQGPCWWDRFYTYILSNAQHPYEVGYTFSRLIDLIAKNQAPELRHDMPDYLPSLSLEGYTDDVLQGILTYRQRLGHIANKNLDVACEFKYWHWRLFEPHALHLDDTASHILKWAWSKSFWSPSTYDFALDDTYRFTIAAMLIKNLETRNNSLFDDIKKRWSENNIMLPRISSFYSKNFDEKTMTWFFYFCPEHSHTYDIWSQYAHLTITKISAYLRQSLRSDKADSKASEDIVIVF